MTIRGYIRVSTLEQAKGDKISLEAQRQRIIGAALMRGVPADDVVMYSDPGVSGSIQLEKRNSGQQLVADIRPGDVLIAAKMDRLFRSTSDALETYERFKADGIDLVLTDMGADSVTRDGVSKLFFSVMSAVAEFERSRIMERMHEGKRAKRERGQPSGGLAPYGYRQVGRGSEAMFVPHEQEQKVTQLVKEMSENGDRSLRQISAELARRGLQTRTGRSFLPEQLARILKRGDAGVAA